MKCNAVSRGIITDRRAENRQVLRTHTRKMSCQTKSLCEVIKLSLARFLHSGKSLVVLTPHTVGRGDRLRNAALYCALGSARTLFTRLIMRLSAASTSRCSTEHRTTSPIRNDRHRNRTVEQDQRHAAEPGSRVCGAGDRAGTLGRLRHGIQMLAAHRIRRSNVTGR